ncbi:NnrS family protein [Intrasporangium sp. DVR]|uniref:NnrS family protein n=1 Tax=Intrasporangium sp. DVR TaxID=3127867 RepID=UPI00313A6B69
MPPPTRARGPAAHRPFFLLTAVAAIVGGAVWLLPVEDPVTQHRSWLLFGMGGAAVAGYLLTALPSWTRGARASAPVVWFLVAAWVAARALAARGTPADAAPAPVAAALVFAVLISLVGGTAVPAFARAALGTTLAAAATDRTQALAPAAVVAAIGLVLGGADTAAGAVLVLVGLVQIARIRRWGGLRLAEHRAVAMLALAWLWLGAGLVMLGLAFLGWPESISVGTAMHALTMGAMGSMIYAFTARATMVRAPGGLVPTALQELGFVLVLVSPLPRLLTWPGTGHATGYAVAVLCWCLGWSCHLARTIRTLGQPPPWPALSASRTTQSPATPRRAG